MCVFLAENTLVMPTAILAHKIVRAARARSNYSPAFAAAIFRASSARVLGELAREMGQFGNDQLVECERDCMLGTREDEYRRV
jgi:hypothetical protein